jgi:hypothetical protein
MRSLKLTRGKRVETDTDRKKALEVLAATYLEEKGWVLEVDSVFPVSDLQREDVSWFLALRNEKPVGVLRVLYDPPIDQYRSYHLKPIDPSIDITKLTAQIAATARIAEIGRFAVIPERRNGVAVALSLIRIATREVVARGYTQLITDVFENDPHSPLGFHTRILGFRPVATHEFGELRHKGRRITLLLDLKRSYQSLKASGNWFFRALTRGWSKTMHLSLAS